MKSERRRFVGKAIAVVSGVGGVLLEVIFLWFNPYTNESPIVPRFAASWLRMGLLVVGSGAAVAEHPALTYAAFIFLFWPAGFYFLLTPGIFAGIGVACLGMLVGALLVHSGRSRRDKS